MLESLVAWVLNNYLGKYVENLNTDQLSIALLSGEVELENLPLRKDALRHLGVPIEIKAGYIGKVKLQIPIRSLRSSPWIINLSGLYLTAGPLNLDDWDQSAEELADQERKLSSLDALEAAWRLETDQNLFAGVTTTHYASSYSSWLQFGTGLITDIIENMQLNINDVHFRFEDASSHFPRASVCGLTIQCISAQSCDENFVPQYSSGSELSFKTIELKNLAVYWDDVNVCDLTSNLPISELVQVLSDGNSEKHCYLVAPVSACAKLQRNRSELPLRSVNSPRIVCDLNLDQVPLTLVDWQYAQMVSTLHGLDFVSRVQQYRRHRPSVSVSSDPKAWWAYAVLCHVPGALRRRPTWGEALERAQQNVQYVEMYTKLLVQPSAALTSNEKQLKDLVEWSRDFFELRALREVSMRRCPFNPTVNNISIPSVPPQNQTSPQSSSQGRSILARWFPQYWGWYSTPTEPLESQRGLANPVDIADTVVETTGNIPSSRQLEDEILEALADSAKNNTILRRDTVFGRFNFCLNGGMLELRASQDVGEKGVTMLDLQFSDLSASIISKPRSSSFSLELTLGVLELRDRLTPGTLFPILVGPPNVEPEPQTHMQRQNFRQRIRQDLQSPNPFFTFTYSFLNSINRLTVQSLPLDVVYHPHAARWLLDFLSAPYKNTTTRTRLEAVRARTKQLTDAWGRQILERDRENIWEIKLDISAPQIILVEKISDPSSAIAVVDLGTLLLQNSSDITKQQLPKQESESGDESENFMTPCSTPPGSETSLDDTKTLISSLNEQTIHQRLYDTYNIELNDIQILVGKIRDNWRHAHTKGSSNLHVLDRFNIFLTLERRVVPTNDPSYPNLTLNANLPRLVAHINEQKITSIRNLLKIISDSNIESPFQNTSPKHEIIPVVDTTKGQQTPPEVSECRLVTLQFTIDQMSLEVQSRGRSVAELQVSGIALSLLHSPPTLHLSLSILSLLLVDALQTLGPGFELLVASHRLVVMDTASGEIRDSEPCSPTSPGSPTGSGAPQGSPEQLAKALEASGVLQNEVLIYGEYTFDKNDDGSVQVVAVRFSNLDIIANQETIVELMGFVRRVFPHKTRVQIPPPAAILNDDLTTDSITDSNESLDIKSKIELNFDFHRLNVLLLRASIEDGRTIGRKIATMTMSDAKIEATVDKDVFIRGSLGGLQILDLIGKSLHQRIISVGNDPLADDFQTKFDTSNKNFKYFDFNDKTAFSFQIKRSLCSNSPLNLTCHLASVWYTHSHLFLGELHSCAAEFKQYLADLARSIKSAATDVALGLVHSRTELLAQTLYAKAGLGVDIQSPRKRRKSIGSLGSFGSLGSESQTPFSPDEEEDSFTGIDIQLNIILDSPVLVLPRSSTSPDVLVGHLGKITISNNAANQNYNTYDIVVKDMNICTLDTTCTRTDNTVQRVESLYNCSTGLPILHDTLLKLQVVKSSQNLVENGFLNKLYEEDNLNKDFVDFSGNEGLPNVVNYEEDVHLKISGCVINDLRVSLTRLQYEQLLDTLQWLTKSQNTPNLRPTNNDPMAVIAEEEAVGVSTLSMDPHVRAKLFPSVNKRRGGQQSTNTETASYLKLGIQFSVASFGVKLCGVHGEGLVGLSFGEFLLTYATPYQWESELQVSLRSLLVEDLLSEKGSFGRQMITSKDDTNYTPLIPPCISKSFPESDPYSNNFEKFASLPDHLDTREIFGLIGVKSEVAKPRRLCALPNPSRSRGHDLVLVTCKFVLDSAPNFKTDYNEIKKATIVDLGSIDVVVSAKSWIPLLEFFRTTGEENIELKTQNLPQPEIKYNSSTTINFSSLTIQLLHNFSNLARAKISGAHLDIFRKGHLREFQGHLGALQIRHPGQENFSCRGERFVTIGEKSLDFNLKIGIDQSDLALQISPFVYVHTKRFIAEIKAFFREFNNENEEQFSKKDSSEQNSKMNLKIITNSCITLFPMSVTSPNLLVLEISKLIVSNYYSETEISNVENAQIDISKWILSEVDFYTAKATERPLLVGLGPIGTQEIIFGDCCVQRTSQSLLKDKGMLEIRVDKNLNPKMAHRQHNVPDMIISCQLSTLEIFLNLEEYALIRGVLSQNLGEDTELILPTYIPNTNLENENFILSSLRIELLDVKVHLENLTCINFIKSRLIMDSYSNLKQDIDLVSRQILITDDRKNKLNIYNEILKPIKNSNDVQCEIHSRRFLDKNKFTILLNNMRLLAISDWWILANNFIFTNFEFSNEVEQLSTENGRKNDTAFELKLNITESEIVVLEDFTKDDTNAVILRSTTLVTYLPNHPVDDNNLLKPLQISVNHLELFSCRFLSVQTSQKLLEDTALSIIDPVTISAELSQNILDIQLHDLTIRVSYRDILLFTAILDSFRRQTVCNKQETILDTFKQDIEKLKSLGFSENDCMSALKICKQLDDAALWLTQNAVAKNIPSTPKNGLEIKNIELRASILRFCLIDDCKDVDVPLLEFCLNNLTSNYDLGCGEPTQEPILGFQVVENNLIGHKTASIETTINVDYYNRVLGGWEPFLEPWKCRAIWKPENTLTTSRNRVALHSDDILNINITDSFLNLASHVKENWLNDFQGPKSNPRSPFVPYSLRNDTGSILYFATVVSDPDEPVRSIDHEEFDYEKHKNLKWIEVHPGMTIPFSYHSRHSKQRHAESHQLRSHQLCVRVFGWQPCFPVTVDQVGVYFRGASPDRGAEPYRITAPRSARIVFEVVLDGSARKLVIVRSAMVLINKLKDSIDVKLVERSAVNAVSTSSRTAILSPLDHFSLPLIHCHSHIFVRPSSENLIFSYSQPDIPWSRISRPNERAFFPLRCTTNRGASYFLCCEIKREKYPIGDVGHTIILIPMLLLVNLLPQDLFFSITSFSENEVSTIINKGRIAPGQNINISSVDTDSNLEINFWIENFKCVSGLKISGTQPGMNEASLDYTTRIRLQDANSRSLNLTSRIETWCGARLRISCWSPWLLRSRAGLPIILKAGSTPLAGQSTDHEIARALAPLPFSLEDDQGGIALTARIGNRYIPGAPQDCAPFHLRRGTQVRRLRVLRNGQTDAVFVLAIEVKPRPITSLVTISPRHQLCNRSSYWLEFVQQCDVERSGANRVCAPPGCYLPFHFPHLDSPLLLSIRLVTPPPHKPITLWSGGVRIESPQSYHLPLFEPSAGLSPSRWGFLHAEVTPQGPTLCLVVSEAGALPPEIRIDNHSEVAVLVRQVNETRAPRTLQNGAQTVHARASVPYAWPEPCGAQRLLIEGPGGETVSVDLKKMETVTLAYENFNYLAFTGTFNSEDDMEQYDDSHNVSRLAKNGPARSEDPINNQRLVLDVPENTTDVILAKKQPGKRSQLFRVTTSGLLEHIASSTSNSSYVLDIGALSPRPSAPPPKLSLRRPDPRRRSTQTWRFTPEGRLCCAHRNTCVQSLDGILGLRPGGFVVLGPIRECPSYRANFCEGSAKPPGIEPSAANIREGSAKPLGVDPSAVKERHGISPPIEQLVGKQKMRPGSGLLSIDVTTDGPTRVVRILDLKNREIRNLGCFNDDWKGVASLHKPTINNMDDNYSEFQITLMLRTGLGLSVIGNKKELIYFQLNNIIGEAIFGAKSREFCISVQDTQIDNQLSNQYPVLLYATKVRSASEQTRVQNLPILELRAVLSPSTGSVLIFKHLIVCLRPLSIHLEENLLLRMYEFFLTALGEKIEVDDTEGSKLDDDLSDLAVVTSQQNISPVMRYHFGIIRLVPGSIRLSVHTALSGTLTPRLRALKRRLGLTLVGFEDAPVELEPYVRHLPFETGQRLVESIVDHFRDELMWQAAAILGSVDFLGSPLGLLGDVSEGVSGLIRERSVGALVLNVAHGLSNSAAKVTETLGDGLGRVSMDESHEEMRQRIRRRGGSSTSSGAHLVAGLKGLGFGVLGGATGIFKQVYEGASNDGIQGVFSGLGKGLVGAVAKPVVGVLDLATETARAVRDSSRGSSRTVPNKRRPPRSPRGLGGLLPIYNPNDSIGQSYLQELTRLYKNTNSDQEIENREFYVSYESVRSGSDDLRVIVSSRRVIVVTGSNPEQNDDKKLTIVTETLLSELVKCSCVTQNSKYYIEMTVKGHSLRRPLIRCDNEEISRSVSRKINYAKRLYEEATHTLQMQDD